jgi:hypothetical protein
MSIKNSPETPDFQAASSAQTKANRADQHGPAASTTWDKSEFSEPFPTGGSVQQQMAWLGRKKAHEAAPPDQQTNDFAGGYKVASDGISDQMAQLGQPMDWSQFEDVGSGDAARQQAIDAAYGQATSRLDPQWEKREAAARTQLMNQGLDPSSEAFKSQMADMSQQRNDAGRT